MCMAAILSTLLPGIFGRSGHAMVERAEAIAPRGVLPPPRGALSDLADTPTGAATLPAVYRALDIIATSAAQISLDSFRDGVRVEPQPAIVRRPSITMPDRAEFIEATVLCMATRGNAYWLHNRAGGALQDLTVLSPSAVQVTEDDKGRPLYHHDGRTYTGADVTHLHRMKLPGQRLGLSPIQAGRAELSSAIDTRDYAAGWFQDSGQPSGVLRSDQELTAADARTARDRWNGLDDDGANPSRIKVLGKGLAYDPILLPPKDAQWIESRQFTVTEVARLFGIPSTLLLAAVEGGSKTYQNVEQEWIAFNRFTLMGYLGKIERALTALVPWGQTVRFNLEALQRPDTLTRYQGHAIALGRWMTVDEVRRIEGLPALTTADRAELSATPAAPSTTPNQEAPTP